MADNMDINADVPTGDDDGSLQHLKDFIQSQTNNLKAAFTGRIEELEGNLQQKEDKISDLQHELANHYCCICYASS